MKKLVRAKKFADMDVHAMFSCMNYGFGNCHSAMFRFAQLDRPAAHVDTDSCVTISHIK